MKKLFLSLLNDKKERLSNIVEPQMLDWQHPSLTEKQAFYNHTFHHTKANADNIYFAFPWATLIDIHLVREKNLNLDSEFVETLKKEAEKFKGKRIHTVCQHIRWEMLKQLWEHIGITDVYLSHCEYQTKNTEQLRFHPWTLIAVNYENPERSNGLYIKNNKHKNYLVSFIGNYNAAYRSDIRKKLKEISVDRRDVCYELGEEWFYQRTVYRSQISREDRPDQKFLEVQNEKTKRYNHTISDSVFSLCPEGSGPNSLRIWESMAVGTIPVIFADSWKPPKIKEFEWEEFSVRIPMEKYYNTINILDSINEETREKMKNNCLNAYKRFSSLRCFA